MRYFRALFTFGFMLLAVSAARPADKADDGFVPMFNGKDLSGWVNVNCHPSTFFVKDGMIITTGKPTGFLRTEKQYENFIADFEWFHVNTKEMGNSGFFVWADPIPATGTGYTRGIEVQVLVNFEKDWATSHGDLFSIWGAACKPDRPHPKGAARCLPIEKLCKGGGEWNHYKVIANNGTIKLHVNGKEVSGVSECNPRKGYLALESEGAECRFRNLKIKELPSTNPKPNEIADEDKGFKSVYSGLDLANFRKDAGHEDHWVPSDWRLKYDGNSEGEPPHLYVDKEYANYEMVVDWALPVAKKGKEDPLRQTSFILREFTDYSLSLMVRGDGRLILLEDADDRSTFLVDKQIEINPPGKWNRLLASLNGDRLTLAVNGKPVVEGMALKKLPAKGDIALMDSRTAVDFANLFIRELK